MSSPLPPSVSSLLSREELPSLRPQKSYLPLANDIERLDLPIPVLGILHLLNDDIDAAHTLVQSDESNQTSNLIHAILHRREGDYWNSKWWLSRIDHPFLTSFYKNTNDAKQFVDQVESLLDGKGSVTPCGAQRKMADLKQKQWDEMTTLAKWILEQYNIPTS